jgi:hypothetical protein
VEGARADALSSADVHWLFTGLLIATSAGIAAYTGWLLRRLFTLEPALDADGEPPR